MSGQVISASEMSNGGRDNYDLGFFNPKHEDFD